MSRSSLACSSLLLLAAACAVDPGDAPPADDVAPDAGEPGGIWPGNAAELRAALGGRGTWTAAWQLDEHTGAARDELGGCALDAIGSLEYGEPGALPDDRAIGFDSADDALLAAAPPFELGRTRSLAALFVVRLEPGAGGAIASRGDGAMLLAVDPATGALSAALDDGAHAATATLPIDHRDGAYHDVLVVIDRDAGVMRVQSDLGRGAPVSIAAIGDVDGSAAFALGAGRLPAATASLAFAAIATGDVAGLVDDGDDALHALRVATGQPAPIVRPPAALPWAPWPIRRDRRGAYTMGVDPRSLRLATDADLWIAPGGDDAAPGTAAQPKRSLHAALAALTAATTIHVAAGTYDFDDGWWGVSPAYDVNIVAEGGRARFTVAELDLVWRASAAGSGVYETSWAARPYTVIDDRAPGVDPWLHAAGSVAEVAATPGSWFAANGVITVHTRDGRSPDAHVRVMPSAVLNGRVDDPARSVYLEGLDLEGGYKALHVARAHRLIVVDTTFRYGAGEGLSVLYTDEVLAFGAIAEANDWDGLAYSWTPRILEVGCAGRDNGRDGSDYNNGSTVHSGGVVVRVGGEYRDNQGPNLADVGGARSWDLGTITGGTRATAAVQRINVYIDGELWLREGSALDDASAGTVDLEAGPGARLHAFDSPYASTAGAVDDRAE